ncbi:MAG: DoxX family protein, partial [Patescibacteria group bacterium]|nr:DoxX family protein [Patescibacteria group bacterium]
NLIGRIIFGLYFVYNGFNHFRHAGGMAGYAASKKVPSPKIAVYVSGALLFLGGLGIVFNIYWQISILLIVIFLVPTTIFMHDFWKETNPESRSSQQIAFLKNVALIGAALLVI